MASATGSALVPLDDATIILKLRNRGISTDLDDPEIEEAIAAWTEHVNERFPLEALGSFVTVAGQQEYDLFGTGQPLDGGIRVLELYNRTDAGDLSLDVFGLAPLIQSFAPGVFPVLDDPSYVFNVPGDFIIADRIWAAFRERFSRLHFLLKENRNGSPILITPTPCSAFTVVVRYARPRTDDEVREDDGLLMLGVEWKALEILARKYALTAGVRIGDHDDRGKTAEIYQKMADKLEMRVNTRLDEQFVTLVSAADRS